MKLIPSAESLSEYWLATWVAARLCFIAALLRFESLPALLERLSSPRRRLFGMADRDRVIKIVVRVCRLPVFRPPVFPRICLRQSLMLYDVLTRLGQPVEIYLGINKTGNHFQAHSWVTLNGKPIADNAPSNAFRILYKYPTALATGYQPAAR